MDQPNVTPLFGQGGRLYAQAGKTSADEFAEGLHDRGLTLPWEPPEPTPVKEPEKPKVKKPEGKKERKERKKRTPEQVQELRSTVIELLGITLLTGGIGMFSIRVAIIILGVCFIALGLAMSTFTWGGKTE